MTFSGLIPHRAANFGGVKQADASVLSTRRLRLLAAVESLPVLGDPNDLPQKLTLSQILREPLAKLIKRRDGFDEPFNRLVSHKKCPRRAVADGGTL